MDKLQAAQLRLLIGMMIHPRLGANTAAAAHVREEQIMPLVAHGIFGQDEPTVVGHWINCDRATRGTIGFSVIMTRRRDGPPRDGFKVASYGKCHPTWSVQVFDVERTVDGFAADVDSGFCTRRLVATLATPSPERIMDTLATEEQTTFTDRSGRPPYASSETFARLRLDGASTQSACQGTMRDLESRLTRDFYCVERAHIRGDHGGFVPRDWKRVFDFRACFGEGEKADR